MKIIENQKIFCCEFCNKKHYRQNVITLHERQCRNNPKNKHKCFQYCKFLKKHNDIFDENELNYPAEFRCINVKCELYNKLLYSFKYERYNRNIENIEQNNLIRMPLICEHYVLDENHKSYDFDKFKQNLILDYKMMQKNIF